MNGNTFKGGNPYQKNMSQYFEQKFLLLEEASSFTNFPYFKKEANR